MRRLNSEYALLIIKPDGVKKCLTNEIVNFLSDRGFKEIIRRNKIISRSFAYNNFTTRYELRPYLEYLSSGESTAIILYGNNAFDRLRILKSDIRIMYGVNGKVENLIHSPEPGNEYQRQFEFFFPDLKRELYSLYVDMYAKLEYFAEYQKFRDILMFWDNQTVSHNIFIFSSDEFCIYKNFYIRYLREMHIDNWIFGVDFLIQNGMHEFRMIGYFRTDKIEDICIGHQVIFYSLDDAIEMIKANKGIPYVGYAENIRDIVDEDMVLAKDKRIVGVLGYHPNYSIAKTEYIRKQFMRYGKIVSGGSGGVRGPGGCSVSYALFKALFNELYT